MSNKNIVALSLGGERRRLVIDGKGNKDYNTMRKSILKRKFEYQYFDGYAFSDTPKYTSDYRMRNAISAEIYDAVWKLSRDLKLSNKERSSLYGVRDESGSLDFNLTGSYWLVGQYRNNYRWIKDMKEQIEILRSREARLLKLLQERKQSWEMQQAITGNPRDRVENEYGDDIRTSSEQYAYMFKQKMIGDYKNLSDEEKIEAWDLEFSPVIYSYQTKDPDEQERYNKYGSHNEQTALYYILKSKELYDALKFAPNERPRSRLSRGDFAKGIDQELVRNTRHKSKLEAGQISEKEIEQAMIKNFEGDNFINAFISGLEEGGMDENLVEIVKNEYIKLKSKRIQRLQEKTGYTVYRHWHDVLKDWSVKLISRLNTEYHQNIEQVQVKNGNKGDNVYFTVFVPIRKGEPGFSQETGASIFYGYDIRELFARILNFMDLKAKEIKQNGIILNVIHKTDKGNTIPVYFYRQDFKSAKNLFIMKCQAEKIKNLTIKDGILDEKELKSKIKGSLRVFIQGHQKIAASSDITNILSELAEFVNPNLAENALDTRKEDKWHFPGFYERLSHSVEQDEKRYSSFSLSLRGTEQQRYTSRGDPKGSKGKSSGEFFSDITIDNFYFRERNSDDVHKEVITVDDTFFGISVKNYITSLNEFTLSKEQVEGMTLNSPQLRRYLTEDEIILLRFFSANSELSKKYTSKRLGGPGVWTNQVPYAPTVALQLMMHNLQNFLRITSAEQKVTNYIFAANGHYIPASCVFNYAYKLITTGQFFPVRITKGPKIKPWEQVADISDNDTGEPDLDMNNLMIDNLIKNQNSLKIRLNEFTVSMRDLLRSLNTL